MINILQVGMTANIGGMETYLMNQYKYIDKKIVHYDFVNITADVPIAFEKYILSNNSKIYNICQRSKNPIRHYWQWIKLMIKVSKKYDTLVFNTCHLQYVFPLFVAKIFGIRHRIIHSHNSGNEVKLNPIKKFLIGFNKLILKFSATDYWACSQTAGKWMFRKKDFKIIHNAINVDKFTFDRVIRKKKRKELNLQNKFVIGHVGRFSYQKNHEFLLDLFYEIAKQADNAILLLIGNYVDNAKYWNIAHKKVEQFNLEDKVIFLGMRADVNELMQAMDCFVLPSHFEGFSIVGIEAQAAGLPCVFSDTITRELAITNLVQYVAIANINEWISDIFKARNMKRKNMRQKITDAGYSIDSEIKNIENIYLQIQHN